MNFIIKIYFVENSMKYVIILGNALKSIPLQKHYLNTMAAKAGN
jgi:hypothetical protein